MISLREGKKTREKKKKKNPNQSLSAVWNMSAAVIQMRAKEVVAGISFG